MEKKEEFTRYEIKNEIRRDIYDHEILLSFYDDDDAYAFEEWLNNQGMRLFNEWIKESEYWNRKVEL